MAELRLGTRGSDLALWQARRIAAAIEQRLDRSCAIEIIKTQGDLIQNVAFHKMEGKGFFTKELQLALHEGRVDLVVHSLKDLPTEEPEGLQVVAIPERAEPADLLLAGRHCSLAITEDNPTGLEPGSVLGTSSLRRAAQALAAQPGLEIRALRGNVPTRIGKLRRGDYDAILVAAAGVRRLQLDLAGLHLHELPVSAWLPAPGQGALAIETRRHDPATGCLAELHNGAIARCVAAERNLLALIGGGCHLPLGCLASEAAGGELHLTAVLGTVDEEITTARVVRVAATAADPETVAAACHRQLQAQLPEVVP